MKKDDREMKVFREQDGKIWIQFWRGADPVAFSIPDLLKDQQNEDLLRALELHLQQKAREAFYISAAHHRRLDEVKLHISLEEFKLRVTKDLLNAKRERSPARPPALAETVFLLLASDATVNAQLGDLQEMFSKDVELFGERSARWKYWRQVVRAVWPAVARIVKRVGIFGIVADYIRAKFGM